MNPDLWINQETALRELQAAVAQGQRRICVTAPTGGGKSRIMREAIKMFDLPTAVVTNRRMLFRQLGRGLADDGISFAERAAGSEPKLSERVQLCMVQTELSRVYRRKAMPLHWAGLLLVDELHVNCNGAAEKLWNDYHADGAICIGFTATPLGIGHMADHLIVAGTPPELRQIGALVRADFYAPDEPDAKLLKTSEKTGEFTEPSLRRAFRNKVIFGRVYDHWKKYNPDALPAILFAPGVPESIWFCEEFARQGVRCAHIDGKNCWLDGEFLPADDETRDYIAGLSKRGEVAIVSNRFVLREGIDWPWLYHGILATAFGSLLSYLQSVGRLLRAYPGKEKCIVQDHGGSWYRHGSPNQARDWDLSMEPRIEAALRQERLRNKKQSGEIEPIACPKCHAVRLSGPECFACGYRHTVSSRMVIQKNGTLKQMDGDVYKPRRTDVETPAVVRAWESTYYRMRKAGMTFQQAAALYAKEHYWKWPPKNLPLMPLNDSDWFRKIEDVPYDQLTGQRRATG